MQDVSNIKLIIADCGIYALQYAEGSFQENGKKFKN